MSILPASPPNDLPGITRVNRLYDVLREVNRSIFSAGDRPILLAEACRIAVENGNLHMACIAMPGSDGKVTFPFHAGCVKGYTKLVDTT